jgi:imidazoleglycerol-phosphate dehydratase
MREASIKRQTKETTIEIKLNLDQQNEVYIETGIPFLDHMFDLFAFHSGFGLMIKAKGDLEVCDHHTVEDIGLALGEAFKKALGDKVGIERYAYVYVPMDETLARVVVDLSNRPYLQLNAQFKRDHIGSLSTENIAEFLKSFVNQAGLTLHVEVLYGANDHHKIEAIFKALGRTLKMATAITSNQLPSTKGVL